MPVVMDHIVTNGSEDGSAAPAKSIHISSKLPAKKNASSLPRPIASITSSEVAMDRRSEPHLWHAKRDMLPELSHLRQENIRLQKEAAAKEKEALDFREKVLAVTKENATLMEELSRVTLDNHKLKMKVISIMEENDTLHSKLSKVNNSFRTYPWSDGSCFSNGKNCSGCGFGSKSFFLKYQNALSNENKDKKAMESWEEVSQKLLMQMKQEMQELENLGHKLALEASGENEDAEDAEEEEDDDDDDDAISSDEDDDDDEDDDSSKLIKDMREKFSQMKENLLFQNSLLKQGMQNTIFQKKSPGCIELSKDRSNPLEDRTQPCRPSDESFRAYFKQQLVGGGGSTTIERNTLWDCKTSNAAAATLARLLNQKTDKVQGEVTLCPACHIALSQHQDLISHFKECIPFIKQYNIM